LSEARELKAFFKAVALGSLAGAALPSVGTIILATMTLEDVFAGKMSIFQTLYLAGLPLLVAVPIVFVSALVLGVATTFALSAAKLESPRNYCYVGAVFGALIPLAILIWIDAEGGFWIAILGTIGGIVTARTWWFEARAPLKLDPSVAS
jgi:hypothetical protein